ncbi:hypothetical protein AgCh_018662 [Apium graveolens]
MFCYSEKKRSIYVQNKGGGQLCTSEESRTPVFVEDDEFVDNIGKNEEFINLDDDLVDVEDEDDNVDDENELKNDYV